VKDYTPEQVFIGIGTVGPEYEENFDRPATLADIMLLEDRIVERVVERLTLGCPLCGYEENQREDEARIAGVGTGL